MAYLVKEGNTANKENHYKRSYNSGLWTRSSSSVLWVEELDL